MRKPKKQMVGGLWANQDSDRFQAYMRRIRRREEIAQAILGATAAAVLLTVGLWLAFHL